MLICWGGIIIILKNWAENWSLEQKLDRKLAKKGAKMAKNSREKKIFSQNLGQGKYVFKVKIGAKMAKNAQKFEEKKRGQKWQKTRLRSKVFRKI